MNLTEIEALADAAIIPFGQAMDGKRFTDAMVRVNRFQMEANPQTVKAMCHLIREMSVLIYDAIETGDDDPLREALAKYEEFNK